MSLQRSLCHYLAVEVEHNLVIGRVVGADPVLFHHDGDAAPHLLAQFAVEAGDDVLSLVDQAAGKSDLSVKPWVEM